MSLNPVRTYSNLAIGLLAVTIASASAAGVLSYKHMAGKVATSDARIAAAEKSAADAKAAIDTLSKEVVRKSELDAAIRASRQNITIQLDKAANEDPVARSYLGERIPDGVRAAYGQAQR